VRMEHRRFLIPRPVEHPEGARSDRFRCRFRYFTDAGIIGSKDFVEEVFDRVKHLLGSKDNRRFTPVSGVEGVYSVKRLSPTA